MARAQHSGFTGQEAPLPELVWKGHNSRSPAWLTSGACNGNKQVKHVLTELIAGEAHK